MKSVIEEIKRRIDIVDYIGQYVPLKKVGENYIALCPFHNENVPSFVISPKKQIATCFGQCNESFDIISFHQKYFNVSLDETIKVLARKAGINYKAKQCKDKDDKVCEPKFFGKDGEYIYKERYAISAEGDDIPASRCHEQALESTNDFYRQTQIRLNTSFLNFLKNEFDPEAYSYLTGVKRGLNKDTIERFSISSITNVKKIVEYLKDTFNTEELSISGLFTDAGYFIFSNHRIVIPYFEDGVPVYLRGRYFKDGNYDPAKNAAKYIGLNNRSTTLHSKRFFNSDVIKKTFPYGELLIVEGEFDAMILSQINLPAIAIPGINNLPRDLSSLNNRKIYLCLDNDDAGKTATLKISEKLNVIGIKPSIIKFKSHHKDFTQWITAGQ
jgi:DNA primase